MAFYPQLFNASLPGKRDDTFYLHHDPAAFEALWQYPDNRYHSLAAWQGRYDRVSLPVTHELIDIIIYRPEGSGALPSYHAHMNGPSVWELLPQYAAVQDLPEAHVATMIMGLFTPHVQVVLPVDVPTRHVLTPEAQIEPFSAQMCLLAKSLDLFRTEKEYLKTLVQTDGLPVMPGLIVAPAFAMNRTTTEEGDYVIDHEAHWAADRVGRRENYVVGCGQVRYLEDLHLNGAPFACAIQLNTFFGGLTLWASPESLDHRQAQPGDLCYFIGNLSADCAIYAAAGGFGH
ncbi:hypothetical protein [Peptococcus simiae]|uniref:hypothetical protein n=1 Tax=Peptococcus simiae TaxID=1643805 RepID=UPI0039816653